MNAEEDSKMDQRGCPVFKRRGVVGALQKISTGNDGVCLIHWGKEKQITPANKNAGVSVWNHKYKTVKVTNI